MTTVQHTVSRFHLLERPVVHPSKCMVCSGYNNPVVDFGLNIKGYGAVVICIYCVGEAGRVVGLISADEITSEKQYAERFITNYLSDNDLVAVPRGFFDIASDSITNLSHAVAGAILHIPMEAESNVSDGSDESAGEQSSAKSGKSEGSGRTSRQSARTSRSGRSNDVSDDPSNEFLNSGLTN